MQKEVPDPDTVLIMGIWVSKAEPPRHSGSHPSPWTQLLEDKVILYL